MSEIAKLKNDIACKQNIINHLAEHNIKLQNQLKSKEQECEELKRQYKELGQCSKRMKEYFEKEKETLSNRFLKLKQILAEIKEICNSVENIENINSLYDAKLSGMYLQANKILQKISEFEVKE